MRTRKLFVAFLSILALAGFGLTAQASAAQPIPGITQTAEWKSMKAYVNTLAAKKNTPATSAQKASFRSRLNIKQAATNARVKKLYNQSLNRVKARDDVKERNAIRKVRQNQSRAIAELKVSLASRLDLARNTNSRAVAKINDRYSFRIAAEKRNLKTLRRNLARTTNPFQRQLILTKIDTVTRELAQQKKALKKELADAADRYQAKVQAINLRYDNRIINTRAYYKALVRKVKSAWKVIYDNDVAAAKGKRTKQFSLVSALKSKGTAYIEQMPSPPPPSSTECRSTGRVC